MGLSSKFFQYRRKHFLCTVLYTLSLRDNTKSRVWNPPHLPGGSNFLGPWATLNLTYLYGGLAKWKNVPLSGWGKEQILLKFVCLFNVKFNFSNENIFSSVVLWHQKYVDLWSKLQSNAALNYIKTHPLYFTFKKLEKERSQPLFIFVLFTESSKIV